MATLNFGNAQLDVSVYMTDDIPTFHVCRGDGKYLTAHEDLKHVYWSDEPDTWETFVKESHGESYILKTYHDTYLHFEDDNMWQCNDLDDVDPVTISHRDKGDVKPKKSDKPKNPVEPKKPIEPKKPDETTDDKPKKKPSKGLLAYQLFARENKEELGNEHSDLKPIEIKKLLKEKWDALSESEKQEYRDRV